MVFISNNFCRINNWFSFSWSVKISNNFKGAGWIILSCLFATVMVSLIKSLGSEVHSTVIVAGRCLIGLLIIFPIIVQKGIGGLKSPKLNLHLMRGCLVAVAINLGFYSLTILPITTVTVLFFSAPLFATLLARPMLGEQVGIRRLGATLVGFVGTVIVIDPSVDSFDLRLLIPVISSVFFSISLVLHKKLSATDPARISMFFMFLVTLILTLPFAAFQWQGLSAIQIGMIIIIAVFATLRTYSDINGYSLGDVSFVAPFQYLRIIFVGLSAYLFFDEFLRGNEWVGMCVIIGSSLYIVHREYTQKQRGEGELKS